MMWPPKKLIEVALPLAAINDASAYDKMPGIGPHPKGIHHWWARLPLPCARAILFASLVEDPSSDPAFADKPEKVQNAERERLFTIIRALLQKKIDERPEVFEQAHKEIVRACDGQLPTVLDPFCGGGSIPLEAQHLGLEAHASDLNPVAVLITKALVEIVPRFAGQPPVNPMSRRELAHSGDWPGGKGLAEDVRFYGRWMRDEAEKRIGHLYPKVKIPPNPPLKKGGAEGGGISGQEATVISWLWARTVKCPNPACAARMALVRSFWLSTKKDKKAWVEPVVDRSAKTVSFKVKTGKGAPPEGTVNRRGATCIVCTSPVPFDHVRAEGKAGRMGAQLMAIVAEGARGRLYLSPAEEHASVAAKAKPKWVPDTDLPEQALGFRVQLYGMTKHRDLFTPRQLLALNTLSDLIKEAYARVWHDARSAGGWTKGNDLPFHQGGHGPTAYADTVTTFLAFALDRCVDFNNSLCRWSPTNEKVMNLFGRGAIPMIWDYAEANILADSVGGWSTCSDYVAECIEVINLGFKQEGRVQQLDAASAAHSGSCFLISTDPPYYDNVGYADLSDFFYVWLRRTLGGIYPDICSTVLVPKAQELVSIPERFGKDEENAKEHFETGFKKAFTIMQQKLDPRFPMTVYYAFKQAESDEEEDENGNGTRIVASTGWETMLEALIFTGFQITGTWPVRASQAWRMRAMGSNALASYIVLVCRPRSNDAPLATRREFVAALKKELPDALKKLQRGNIAPVDLAQASIGPGMAVFSRYAKALEADGSPMKVRTALQLINQTLDEYLAQQEGEYDADTRWALAWFEQFGMAEGPFGAAETLSKAKNTSVKGMEDAGLLRARGGKVRLLKRDELPDTWDPATDPRLTVWEATQYFIRSLEQKGENAAADLLRRLGGVGEAVRDLAYRLYAICERKRWAEEALAYNSLVVAWPRLVELAARVTPTQETLAL